MLMTSHVAEICGALMGDGWIESTGMGLYIAGHLTEDREYYDNYLCPLFSKTFVNVTPREYSYWNVYGFGVYTPKVIKTIIGFGMKKGYKASVVKFPKWIFDEENFAIAALRGILDTDGSVYCEKNYSLTNPKFHTKIKIGIATISRFLADDLVLLLNRLGVKNFLKVYYPKRPNWKVSYRVVIDGGINVIDWFDKIGSSNPKHVTKFLIWKKFGFCPPNTSIAERKKILSNKLDPCSYYK